MSPVGISLSGPLPEYGEGKEVLKGFPEESSLLLCPATSCPVGGEMGGWGWEGWEGVVSAAAAGSDRTSPEYNDYGRGKCQDPACLWEHCRSGETKNSMEQRQCGSNPRGHQCHEVHERGSQGKSSEAENRSEAYRSHPRWTGRRLLLCGGCEESHSRKNPSSLPHCSLGACWAQRDQL